MAIGMRRPNRLRANKTRIGVFSGSQSSDRGLFMVKRYDDEGFLTIEPPYSSAERKVLGEKPNSLNVSKLRGTRCPSPSP
jgi:hypothetical protein